MQDPYFAVKEEVEHSVTVVVDLHARWKELSASAKKSDEWEWTACARAARVRSLAGDACAARRRSARCRIASLILSPARLALRPR